MMNNGNGTSACNRASEIPEYIYQELTDRGRVELERHFSACAGCAAELKGMTNAHLAVMQWRDESFAGLSTPKIVIPFGENQSDQAGTVNSGWLDSIHRLLGNSTALQWGGGLVAVAAVALIAFIAVNMIRVPVQPSVAKESSPRVDGAVAGRNEIPQQVINENVARLPDEAGVVDTRSPTKVSTGLRSRSSGGSNGRRSPRSGQVAVDLNGNGRAKKSNGSARKLPSLNDVADDDDNSLRLSDLFEEIGS